MSVAAEYWPEVVQAVPGPGRTVYAYFSDGSIHQHDIQHLIKPGTVFEALSDRATFENTLTVANGAVAWDLTGNSDLTKIIDLDPFTVYLSPRVPDPLAATANAGGAPQA